jgi:hypothetical protein
MNLTFLAGGRRRRLFRRRPNGNFHIRFEHRKRIHTISMKTTLEHVAKEKAKQKIEQIDYDGNCDRHKEGA